MKTWKERVITVEEGKFRFGVACCGVQVSLTLHGETRCLQCKRPCSFAEILAAHGLTQDDLPCQPVLHVSSQMDDLLA